MLKGDIKGTLSVGENGLLQLFAAASTGITTAEYETLVNDWIATARHPRFNQPYTAMVCRPIQELRAHLRANSFKTFIVSGGGKLDRALDEAEARGWTVVDMRRDWKVVFPFEER